MKLMIAVALHDFVFIVLFNTLQFTLRNCLGPFSLVLCNDVGEKRCLILNSGGDTKTRKTMDRGGKPESDINIDKGFNCLYHQNQSCSRSSVNYLESYHFSDQSKSKNT